MSPSWLRNTEPIEAKSPGIGTCVTNRIGFGSTAVSACDGGAATHDAPAMASDTNTRARLLRSTFPSPSPRRPPRDDTRLRDRPFAGSDAGHALDPRGCVHSVFTGARHEPDIAPSTPASQHATRQRIIARAETPGRVERCCYGSKS